MAQSMNVGTAGARRAYPVETGVSSPAYQAYQILHWGFTVAPILFGLDKFFNLMTQWHQYLAPIIGNLVPLAPRLLMQVAGGIEILAGLIVAFKPRIGGYLVAAWMGAIIVNLLLYPGYYDIALRDFGLCLGALALARLSSEFERG